MHQNQEFNYASFYRRLAAHNFEKFLSLSVLLCLAVFIFLGDEFLILLGAYTYIVVGVVFFLIDCVFHLVQAKSIGYWFFGLRVVDPLHKELKKAPRIKRWTRFFLKDILSYLVLIFGVVLAIFLKTHFLLTTEIAILFGFLPCLAIFVFYFGINLYAFYTSPNKQMLYDKWTGLIVVDEKRKSKKFVWFCNIAPLVLFVGPIFILSVVYSIKNFFI